MKRLKLFFACLLMAVLSIGQVWGAEAVYKTALFGSSYNSKGVSGYTDVSFSSTNNGFTVDVVNANNNNNGWNVIKIGGKKGAYTGSITTHAAIDKAVTKVDLTIDAITADNVTSITLKTSSNGSSWSDAGTFTKATGTKTVTLSSPAENLYYQIVAVCTQGSSNGLLTISKVEYYVEEGGGSAGSMTPTPTSVEVGQNGEDDGSIAISYSGISDMTNVDDVAIYDDADHTFDFSGSWLVADWNSGKTAVEYFVEPNTGAARTAYIYLYAIDDNGNDVEKIIEVSQAAYVAPFDGLELTFPDYNDASVSSYTASWTATKSGQVWDIYGFNNNGNAWSVIKAGRKIGTGSTALPVDATIATQVVGHAVGDIVVTVDAVTAAQITSHKLYVADNSSFDGAIEIAGVPATIAAGDITYTVPVANRANDLYYKLEYATAGTAGGNGILTISKITYAYATAAPQKQSTGLAYADELKNHLVKVGASYDAPELTNPDHLTGITYASSDDAIVEVNETTGALTIKAAGKAVITASRAEDDTYKAGSASYTIYVATEAGTAGDPLSETSAKTLIDLGCTMYAHVAGVVSAQDGTYYTVTLSDGFKFWSVKDIGNVDFTTAYLTAGDQVTAYGQLLKYNSTYELATGCYLTSYTHPTSKTPIVSDIDNPITVAAAIGYLDDPTTYDLSQDVWVRGVVTYVGQTNGQSPKLYIDVKDANEENTFRFFDYTVNSSITQTPQVNDILIATGKLDKYNTTNELNVCEVVSLVRPEVAVTSVELDQDAASIEVGETVTLHATVNPNNASNKAITWSVQSGSEYATVDAGVVTGILAGGTAVIRAASTADPTKYAECTVTVTAVDPTKHVVTFDATVDAGESPLSKSNISMACSSGALNNGSEYRLYKSSTTTFECSVGNIIKIEFTGVSGNPVSGFGDPEVGSLVTDGNDGVWTGNAASVSFVASGAQVRATEIKVTYKEDNRDESELAWNPADDIEITVGDAFTAPTLLNPNSIDASEISIESSNTSLATVTAGVVSLVADATGTATITATFNGNDDYKPATVSYNITVNEAGLDNVTFDSSEDHAESGETTITKSGFTLSFTSGSMDGTQAEYRLYKSQTMTLSSTDYLIKKIEFTCTSGNPISGFADATGLDKDNNEWTGESNTVELTASNAQVRMTKIKVFYVEDTRAAAGLAWDPADDIELTVGDAFSAPALLNPNSIDAAEITIESSNTDLATVSEGVVSLVADATGTTTITATFAGNDDYKPATVSYKITVNPAYSIYVQPSLNVNFGSVNQNAEVADKSITVTLTGVDAATLTLEGTGASAFTISPAAALTASGDITISASSANIGTFAATLTISDDANNAESKVVNISITVNEVVTPETPVSTTSKWVPATEITDGMQVLIVGERNEKIYAVGAQTSNNRTAVEGSLSEGVFTPGENTMAFTVVAQEGGTYALQASNGKYLYAAGSGSGKNYLRSQDEVDDNAKWTLSVSSATANGTNTNNKLQLNNSSDIFSCYSSTQKAIALYVPKQDTPEPPVDPEWTDVRPGETLTVNKYYTVCLDKAITDIQGATLWSLNHKNNEGTMAYLVEETPSTTEPLEAGKPFFMFTSSEHPQVVYTGEATSTPVENGALRGTLTGLDANAINSIIAATASEGGIYMLYDNALRPVKANQGNYLLANRAYVLASALTPGNPSNAPGKRVIAMPMQGQTATGVDALNATETPVKMIIDGQMYILRGEKLYDATGRLVK